MVKPRIILASSSPRRKDLLQQVGLDFEIIPSGYDEDMELSMSPYDLAKHLAYCKAKDVAQKYPTAVVIGADSFAVFNNKPIGKPHTIQKAKETLRMLAGQTHELVTGVCVIQGEKEIVDEVRTKVTFRNLTDQEIETYMRKENILEHAGAYKIQALGVLLVEKIEGDYFNIVGLPLKRLTEMLLEFDIHIL